ncbi:MAG TPA: hypothetical protein VFT22_31960, partial [Kofleriaceae bacterium]|nr:hypothetical protein [Kofleriaceae bacterium]
MGFLERLRGYLERVERAADGLPVVGVDLAAHRRHFAEACDRLRAARLEVTPVEVELEEQQIQDLRETLPVFVEEVADHVVESLVPAASQDEVTKLVNVAISWELWGGDHSTTGSLGMDDEIARIAELARARVKRRRSRDAWESPARYAHEIRTVTRKHPDRHTLTRSGAVLLGLTGFDAVRWLLALEAAQSLGATDEWRISPELAAQLLTEPVREIEAAELRQGSWRFSLATLRRLDAMRLIRFHGQDPNRGRLRLSYAVLDRARPVLEEIAEQRATPFAVLADALGRDEVAGALEVASPGAERARCEGAATSVAMQARMVVHELRDALVPAQVAFSRLNRELAESQPALLQQHRERIDAGIQRALAFAEELLRVASLGVGSRAADPGDSGVSGDEGVPGVS